MGLTRGIYKTPHQPGDKSLQYGGNRPIIPSRLAPMPDIIRFLTDSTVPRPQEKFHQSFHNLHKKSFIPMFPHPSFQSISYVKNLYMQAALTQYAQRLREWNQRINLVGPETLNHLEQRHLADCLQLVEYLPAEKSLNIMDLGTGAGLPGILLAIACPQHQFTLVESDSRKCAFLRTVIHDLALTNTTVLNQRLEALNPTPMYQVITARAFAPLAKILPLSREFLAPNGHWLLLKGVAVDEELRTCETLFPMTTARWQSKVADEGGAYGWVLKIAPDPTAKMA